MNSMLDVLQNRRSLPARLLVEPAPNDTEIEEMIKCAITAPDHGAMHPWRFIIIRNDARGKLGEVFVDALKRDKPDASAEKIHAVGDKPLRAPLIITVVATVDKQHRKTPPIEQILSAGVAASQLQLAANAMGFASIWLTGPNAYDPSIKQSLGVTGDDEIVGFIYLGTPSSEPPPKQNLPVAADHISEWHGP